MEASQNLQGISGLVRGRARLELVWGIAHLAPLHTDLMTWLVNERIFRY